VVQRWRGFGRASVLFRGRFAVSAERTKVTSVHRYRGASLERASGSLFVGARFERHEVDVAASRETRDGARVNAANDVFESAACALLREDGLDEHARERCEHVGLERSERA